MMMIWIGFAVAAGAVLALWVYMIVFRTGDYIKLVKANEQTQKHIAEMLKRREERTDKTMKAGFGIAARILKKWM